MRVKEKDGAGAVSAEVVREFLSALVARETYDPRRNTYILFGLLWGLPIPLLGLLLESHVSHVAGTTVTLDTLWHPLHIVLGLHPLFFAVLFGALGTIRLRKTARINDLVERLAHEVKRLAIANADLKELDRLKDEFLGNVTHELKTPLVTIRGYTEMLQGRRLGDLDEKQLRAIEVVRRNALRLQDQIERLLACSRNREHLDRLRRARVPLAGLLQEVEERHHPTAEAKGVRLAVERPAAELALWGDRARLVEVLDNLVANALKFTDAGGVVTLRFGEPAGARLPAEVVDTGCGIPPDAVDHIFDRFRQADGSIRRTYGGSGLGLAIVRSNLEAHGCGVRVESQPGRGARFVFELPLASANAKD
jgi:signal transduction histidine kinase